MFKVYFVLLLTIAGQSLGDKVTDGTKLISTFMVHRHGDRTPVSSSISFCTDVEATEAATAEYGYGQLTTLGKQRAYKLGKFIRARYDELLSDKYNASEIYIRSTDATRTKMTILSAMAAVYPAYPGSWSNEINWVPVPYTTVPVKYDFNEAVVNCPNYLSGYYALMLSNPSRMSKYFDYLNVVAAQSGINITSVPCLVSAFYDAYVSQEHLGVPLSDEIAAIMPQLKEAAGEAWDVIYGDEDYIRLSAGPLLNEFFTYTAAQIEGSDTPAVRIYSAHDANVYSFMSVAQITPRQGAPPYASAFALELRQVEETGKYVVLAVYQSDPSVKTMYIPIAGCDSLLCDYDTYKEIVSAYIVDEDTWRTECGFTDDLVVDESSLN